MNACIHGYAASFSAKAGQSLDVMLSGQGATFASTELVRLVHGDADPAGPGFVEVAVPDVAPREVPLSWQPVQKGSYLEAIDASGSLAPQGAFTVFAFVHPTWFGRVGTALSFLDAEGFNYSLSVTTEGRVAFALGDGDGAIAALEGEATLLAHSWYLVAVSVDFAAAEARLAVMSVTNRYNGRLSNIVPYRSDCEAVTGLSRIARSGGPGRFLAGGAAQSDGTVATCFNGKLDRFGICRGTFSNEDLGVTAESGRPPLEAIAWWDTSQGVGDGELGDMVFDVGPHRLHATGFNRPVRAMTGWNWRGRDDCFRLAPWQYGGIEFHHDALTDCRWDPTLRLDLPVALKSGAYALKATVRDGAGAAITEYVTFFVRPAEPRAPVCFLVPTASYLAYANSRGHLEGDVSQAILARLPVLQRADVEGVENGLLFGLSTYDRHDDGAGVCYTTSRRPMFTMNPHYRVPGVACAWQFPADLSVLAWLDHWGYVYEVITDEDLDREGVDALKPYRLVINGTHAEYYSERMLDATEDYLAGGGRITYLSGNGYYWVVAFRPDEPGIMEVRKLDSGSRAWQARPGECYLATTGERGGLWRLRGRPPQKLVGTGFASEGMDRSFPFHRLPDSHAPDLDWMWKGIHGDVIGDFGLAHGGAVGLEIDRYDLTLGTPPHARLVASSGMLTDNWQIVTEDVMFMYPGLGGEQHPLVRCDMVYFTTMNGGGVFSPSSIAFGSALPVNGFDNNVSTLMRNVVDRFIDPAPLE